MLRRQGPINRLQRACSVAPPRDDDTVLLLSIRHLAVYLHRFKIFAPHGEDHDEVAGLSMSGRGRRSMTRIQVARLFEMHLPTVNLWSRNIPMLQTALRAPAEHEADDATIRTELPNRIH